jgi:hypothetical protein
MDNACESLVGQRKGANTCWETVQSIRSCCRWTWHRPGSSITTSWDWRSFPTPRGDRVPLWRPTKLVVTKSTTGTADSQTQIGWEVGNLQAELDLLRARGVTIEEYDLPGLKTENGVADMGFALIAWIVDPGKNALGIIQRKM